MTDKSIAGVYNAPQQHWVGDGFPVRSLFSYSSHGAQLSPFLLLDYAGPEEFDPSDKPRGVGEHPHRGFETVTIVYEGEVAHRDSTGAGGTIYPGDVQWMTAASGILHDEFHSPKFTQEGGTLEMVQLWVNLPAKDKLTEPKYQEISHRDIPSVNLPENAGRVRVIAGEFHDQVGPAETFTPMDVWDVRLSAGGQAKFSFVEGRTTAVVLLRGDAAVNGESMQDAQLMLLERAGEDISIHAKSDSIILLLSGEPIDEPIVGQGPFVMNTQEEIQQAFREFSSGKFGRIAS
tara:strand:- start:10677 stop:11546 length:870 start_codon:yes stop_codon:yes gene_type:complete